MPYQLAQNTDELGEPKTDAKAAEGASDGKASDGKANDGKANDGKANDGKTNDGKTGDGKAADAQTAAPATAAPAANAAAPTAAEGAAPVLPAADQTTATTAVQPWYQEMLHSGAMGYMIDGGIFMWPILLCGIMAAGVIIERFRSLKLLRTDTEKLRADVLRLLQDDRVEEALEMCDSQQGPVPAILATGLRKFLVLRRLNYDVGKIEEQVVKAMDDYGVHIVGALERHLPILGTVSSVAPMLGFLGTVQGMVISFDDIVKKMGEVNIVQAAAAGIMIALLTTVFGLVVGIPAFTAYNYFTSVINRFVLEVEETATDLIEAVTLQIALSQQDGHTAQENGADVIPARPRPATL